MEYSKCQQGDDDDDDEEEEEDYNNNDHDKPEEEFEDEPEAAAEQIRRRQRSRRRHDDYYTDEKPKRLAAAAATATTTTKSKMAPLEMESNNNDDDDDAHVDDGGAEEDAVSLLGSDVADAGGFYNSANNSNASNDGSTYSSSMHSTSRRSGAARGINHYRYSNNSDNNITLREMAVVQGRTCCPVYFCIVILLSLLVGAIFVAPPAVPSKSSSSTTTTTADNNNNSGGGSDSHYRSPASSAAQQQQQQQQQLQCEAEITTGTSWDVYVQNVSSPSYNNGNRCIINNVQPNTNTTCRCQNPTIPDFPHEPAFYAQRWQQTFQQNLNRIAQWETAAAAAAAAQNNNNHLDVVFLGDSITEHWVGTDLSMVGQPPDHDWSGNVRVFHSLFGDVSSVPMKSSTTTNLTGMPLGISGDRCPNLLYRLENGELLSESLQSPPIFWILIGTNDVGADQCLASQIIAGTIAIVKYIQQERPNAKIVLNSILPTNRKAPSSLSPVQVLDHWREVYQPINQGLDCFVQGFQNDNNHDDNNAGKLYFFNATDLFLTSDSQSINYTLLPDGLHPGEEGSWIWGRAMVKTIQDILGPS